MTHIHTTTTTTTTLTTTTTTSNNDSNSNDNEARASTPTGSAPEEACLARPFHGPWPRGTSLYTTNGRLIQMGDLTNGRYIYIYI